jgi:hypothetical protein
MARVWFKPVGPHKIKSAIPTRLQSQHSYTPYVLTYTKIHSVHLHYIKDATCGTLNVFLKISEGELELNVGNSEHDTERIVELVRGCPVN